VSCHLDTRPVASMLNTQHNIAFLIQHRQGSRGPSHILQANRTASDLAHAEKLGQQNKAGYSLEDGLPKKHGKLVVAKPVRTDLIEALNSTLAAAHLSRQEQDKEAD
jgi:hypothetical protein